ncbi:hypothetical protein C1H46_000083 [Malus baccata]|uniref:Uncharacterized protein n=1 Tax=Malus baccata TaxID=106549 RepID=A0A540NT05_MALBA|nr:hypothetical protein C1H46_000083 [Malus baccata]
MERLLPSLEPETYRSWAKTLAILEQEYLISSWAKTLAIYEEGLSIFAGLSVRWGWRLIYIGVSLTTSSNAIPLPCQSTLKKWYVVCGKLMLRVKITDSFIQGDPALAVGKVLPLRFLKKKNEKR